MEELGCIGGIGIEFYDKNDTITYPSSLAGSSGTGGLLIVYGNRIVNNGSMVSYGTDSTPASNARGGASGGGCVNVMCYTYSGGGGYSAVGGSGGSGGSGGNGYAGVTQGISF